MRNDEGGSRVSKYSYFIGDCVGWPRHDVHREGGLVDMIDNALDISLRTFREAVGVDAFHDLAMGLGYAIRPSKGLTIGQDYHVSFHRSKLHGRRVYFLVHSGIEHVYGDKETCLAY